jgi:hypothetical protein
MVSPVNGSSTRIFVPCTAISTVVPMSRLGTEYRADPNRTQDSLPGLAAGRPCADLRPQRRQLTEQLALVLQPARRHGADLRVHRGVDLGAPRSRRPVRRQQVTDHRRGGHDQVPFGIADQVLHDLFRLRLTG